jgi:hypothetical protein
MLISAYTRCLLTLPTNIMLSRSLLENLIIVTTNEDDAEDEKLPEELYALRLESFGVGSKW